MKHCLILAGLLASLSPVCSFGEPVSLWPNPGGVVYFHREYSPEHLAANADQSVTRMVVDIDHSEGGDSTPGYGIAVVLKESEKVYQCFGFFNPESDDLFFLETDREGESATLQAQSDHVLLKLRNSDRLTLTAEDGTTFVITAEDTAHRTFKLYPATQAEAALRD